MYFSRMAAVRIWLVVCSQFAGHSSVIVKYIGEVRSNRGCPLQNVDVRPAIYIRSACMHIPRDGGVRRANETWRA